MIELVLVSLFLMGVFFVLKSGKKGQGIEVVQNNEQLIVELLQRGGLNAFTGSRMQRHSPEYKAYLKSPEWKARREAVLIRDNHECCFCGTKKRLQVHHKRYDDLGNEPLTDLATFCHDCHKSGHRSLAARRRRSRSRK